MKKPFFAPIAGGMLAALLMTGVAMAEQIGVVDLQVVQTKYAKAQSLANQAKTKEDELLKVKNGLMEQLKAGEKLSPVEKKNLEDRLNNEMAAKVKEYRDWLVTQQNTLSAEVDKAIKDVSTMQKIDVVLPKQAVLNGGGKDITNDVVTALNK